MLPSHLYGHSALGRRRPRLSATAVESPAAGGGGAAPLEEHDRIYFQSYSHLGIHEAMTMIKDRCLPHSDHAPPEIYRGEGCAGCGVWDWNTLCSVLVLVQNYFDFPDPIEVKQDHIIEGSRFCNSVPEQGEPTLSEYSSRVHEDRHWLRTASSNTQESPAKGHTTCKRAFIGSEELKTGFQIS